MSFSEDKLQFYLNGALEALRSSVFELESHIGVIETLDGSVTETNYNDMLFTAIRAIGAAEHMVMVLKMMSESTDLEPPVSVPGARYKVNLGYNYTEKDESARIALLSARAILESHDKLVDSDVERVVDVCYKIMDDAKAKAKKEVASQSD